MRLIVVFFSSSAELEESSENKYVIAIESFVKISVVNCRGTGVNIISVVPNGSFAGEIGRSSELIAFMFNLERALSGWTSRD